MRLLVLGAGAIGPAAAALAVARGHRAVLWSPSGRGTAGLTDHLTVDGLPGTTAPTTVPVGVASDLAAALGAAEAVLVAVPANGLAPVLERLAAALPEDLPEAPPILIAPAASLAPLLLDRLLAERGLVAPIGALSTTPLTGRRTGPAAVRIGAIREAVEIGAVPPEEAPRLAGICADLWGNAWPVVADAFAAALININPIAHAALAATNVTRIETAEDWPQYRMMTPAVCRLMQGLAAERATLAAAYGHAPPGLEMFFHRTNGVPLGPLAEMTQAIHATRGAVLGPKTLATRYVEEDVPYGLAFYLVMAARAGVPMPLTEATIRLLEALWGRELRRNALLDRLDPEDLPAPAG